MNEKKLKAWLNRAYNIDDAIKRDLDEIQKIDILIETGFGVNYEAPRVQTSSRNEATFASKIERLSDIKREYVERVIQQEELKYEIRFKIEELEDSTEKSILRLRHIDFLNWYDIANEIHYSIGHCHRIYNRAIKNLIKKFNQEESK